MPPQDTVASEVAPERGQEAVPETEGTATVASHALGPEGVQESAGHSHITLRPLRAAGSAQGELKWVGILFFPPREAVSPRWCFFYYPFRCCRRHCGCV